MDPKVIDYTLLKKHHSHKELEKFLETARKHNVNVCIPPCRISEVVKKYNKGRVITVIGFPQGLNTTQSKVQESKNAIDKGAEEIDVACNISYIKSGEIQKFKEEMKKIKEVCRNKPLKAIIETGLLTDKEKKKTSKLCLEAGVDYIKTCTGFTKGQATVKDIKLIKEAIGNKAKIKASGKIRNKKAAENLLNSGASRIGTSSIDQILN